MKLPKALHSAAKVRMDYNENHDEKGRFSVSSGSGASYKTETMPFGDKGAAKAYAKRASNADKNKTFDVRDHMSTGSSKVHHSYYQGKEITAGAKGNPGVSGQPSKIGSLSDIGRRGDKPATREGAAKAGAAVRALQAKTAADAKYKVVTNSHTGLHGVFTANGHSPLSEHKDKAVAEKRAAELGRAYDRNMKPNVAPDVKSSESPAGAKMRGELPHSHPEIEAGKIGWAATHQHSFNEENHASGPAHGYTEEHPFTGQYSGAVKSKLAQANDKAAAAHALSVRKSGPRSANARHLAPKGEPTRAEREAAYAKRSEGARVAEIQRHTDNFNEMKQNHTGGGSLKAYLAKHMKS